ncbi:hypothetical protein Mapa_012879 [Marchantia paleacea]|nr:hypothetical protein Mapa_012879 [Marchantia paleacea]
MSETSSTNSRAGLILLEQSCKGGKTHFQGHVVAKGDVRSKITIDTGCSHRDHPGGDIGHGAG